MTHSFPTRCSSDLLDGACLHGTDRDGNVAMSGQDNDGHRHAALIKNLLHLESVHLGHTNVEKDASRLDMTNLAQEGDARWIGSDRIARRLEHEPCRAQDRLFFIDDVDHPLTRPSYSPPHPPPPI